MAKRARKHARKSGTKPKRNARRARPRAPRVEVVTVENPRPIAMSKHKRRKGGKKRRHARKHNPAPHRRRRRHRHEVHARRRHARRRNPGSPIADLLLAVGAGALAAVTVKLAAKEAANLLPSTTPAAVVSGGKIAAGVLGALLLKKHPSIAAAVAVGAGAPGLLEIVNPYLPASLQAVGFEGVLPNVPRLPAPRADMGAVDFAAVDFAGGY